MIKTEDSNWKDLVSTVFGLPCTLPIKGDNRNATAHFSIKT